VCPNCHAVLHLKDPPYTPEEVRWMIGRHNKPGTS
jgi:predicted HNH restriction endonuclease